VSGGCSAPLRDSWRNHSLALLGRPIGCGALKFHRRRPTEIKRMWVAATARGLGIGRRLLAELEARAARQASCTLRLETNRSLTEAVAM